MLRNWNLIWFPLRCISRNIHAGSWDSWLEEKDYSIILPWCAHYRIWSTLVVYMSYLRKLHPWCTWMVWVLVRFQVYRRSYSRIPMRPIELAHSLVLHWNLWRRSKTHVDYNRHDHSVPSRRTSIISDGAHCHLSWRHQKVVFRFVQASHRLPSGYHNEM